MTRRRGSGGADRRTRSRRGPIARAAVQAARADEPVTPKKKTETADQNKASRRRDAPRCAAAALALPAVCCLQVERHDAAAAGAASGCMRAAVRWFGRRGRRVAARACLGRVGIHCGRRCRSGRGRQAAICRHWRRSRHRQGAPSREHVIAALARPRSEFHRLQRLLAEPAGRAAVNAKGDDWYTPCIYPFDYMYVLYQCVSMSYL